MFEVLVKPHSSRCVVMFMINWMLLLPVGSAGGSMVTKLKFSEKNKGSQKDAPMSIRNHLHMMQQEYWTGNRTYLIDEYFYFTTRTAFTFTQTINEPQTRRRWKLITFSSFSTTWSNISRTKREWPLPVVRVTFISLLTARASHSTHLPNLQRCILPK